MPTLPKLSDHLRTMSEHIASVESKIDELAQGTNDTVSSGVASAKEKVKSAQSDFNQRVSNADASAREHLQNLEDSFNTRVEQARAAGESRVKAVDAHIAEANASSAEVYAEDTMAFALLAMAEAEAAALDAIQARNHADSLKDS